MAKILGNFHLALVIGVVLLLVAMFGLHGDAMDGAYWTQWLRFLHTFAGVLWIGLLYYFNFVQIPTMPKVPAELKPGVSKYIAPAALFWFRWAALATVILGLLVAETSQGGYVARALSLTEGYRTIGIGMWLGLIMAANVWFIIWPNQKRALGIVPADDDRKARSATTAMIASRTNLILSIPMLYAMITQSHVGG
ncbi:MAG TPA: urate hydroxylase PuuD [Allosphingosinicella sp.]|uniref:urate hydroxylase PuuD n=1 Tax=Allosphingosinicella sp. TaxID=2823234 RepID=UPI002EDB637D